MKQMFDVVTVSVASVLLSGCTALEPYLLAGGVASAGIMTYSLVTGRCMNGLCPGTEEYREKYHPNSYADWEKAETTDEQRRKDALDCGGTYDLFAPDRFVVNTSQLEAERYPEERYLFSAKDRLTKKWAACMESKGYTPQSGPFYGKP